MSKAGWQPADPGTFRRSFGIDKSILLKHAYPTAPVSKLLFDEPKQDLDLEQPLSSNATQRHHVRF